MFFCGADEADVVCCTLSAAGSPFILECMMNSTSTLAPLPSGKQISLGGGGGAGSGSSQALRFDVLIIDEACQSTEASALIPFKYNPKVATNHGKAISLVTTERCCLVMFVVGDNGGRSEAIACYCNKSRSCQIQLWSKLIRGEILVLI